MNLRRAWGTALWAVRAYPGSTALLAGASAITVGVTLPVLFLASGRLRLPAAPDPSLPVTLSAFAGTPATMQAQGLDAISGLLVALGIAALAVGVLTAGSLAAGRATSRRREIAVRRAVGAGRGSLRLAGVVEGLLLALGVFGIGLVPATAAARWAVERWPGTLIAGVAGVVAGLVTVFAVLLAGSLAGVRAPGGTRVPHPGASSHGLVIPILQFAISLAILTAAARTSTRATQLLRGAGAGRDAGSGSVYQIVGDSAVERRALRYEALVHSLKARHVDLVSLSAPGALVGLGLVDFVTTDCGQCVEGFVYTPFRPVPAMITAMTADTFRATGFSVVRGRGLSDTDSWSAPRVALVSASLAARDFQHGDPLGRQIFVGRGTQSAWYRVVGVVPDRVSQGFGGALAPAKAVYLSALQAPPARADLLVSGVGGGPLPGATRIAGETTLSALQAREARAMAWFGTLARGAGWAVLVIALAGMFAVMERWVAAAAPELAVRRAVGARPRDILRFVLARALGVAWWGAGAGLVLSIFASGALGDAFPGLPAWSWPAALTLGAGLLTATVLGALVPGWKVIRVAPAAKLAELEG